jgi:anti-sigma-K factor RskA
MSTHIFDELPLLLTGEADRATVALAADHLRECEDCQQELVSALIAHASLSSAARFAPELRSLLSTEDAEDRPAEPADLPDLTPIFEMAKQEARAPRHSVVAPRSRSRRARWIAVAAVAGVLVGGGAVFAAQNLGGTPAARTVQLGAFDQGRVAASAKLVGSNEVQVDASSLPAPESGKNYEVWLTDTARKSLQPVGWIGSNGRTRLQIPSSLLDKFTNIEVSVQDVGQAYEFSGESVLRGSYR